MTDFDALVIGGGPAGCAASIRLAQLRRGVALAEGRTAQFKIGESLPPAVKPILAELGALSACDGALTSFGNQSAWGSARVDDTDFIRDPNGPGFHIDRLCFERGLLSVAAESGATLLDPVRVGAIKRKNSGWLATLTTEGQTVSARWIVDCTGRNAAFAQSQNARRMEFDRLVAIAAVFHGPGGATEDRDSRTLVESAETGWWYTSLIPAQRRIVVFLTDPSTRVFRRARTVQGFLALLGKTQHLHSRIADGGYRMASPLRAFAANSSLLENVVGDGWLAAGDAASAFDPLSSQGILTALYTGIHAAETVNAMLNCVSGAADRYQRIVSDVFDTYLETRDRYYRMERRWPASPFWNTRLLLRDHIV